MVLMGRGQLDKIPRFYPIYEHITKKPTLEALKIICKEKILYKQRTMKSIYKEYIMT